MKGIERYKEKAAPPEQAKKQISGGRLKGMTDIKPQWRMQALTEQYGLCGFGWYYEVITKDIIAGSGDEQIGIVDINLFVKVDDEWSKPIFGTGGSSFTTKEKFGVHTSDEVFKMALTDAISVAAKSIGIASDVYLGYSDSKYYAPKPAPPKPVDNRSVLTSANKEAFTACVSALVSEEYTMVDIEKKYIVSDAVRTKLNDEAAKKHLDK